MDPHGAKKGQRPAAEEPDDVDRAGIRAARREGDQPAAPDPGDFSPMLASSGSTADLPDKDWQFELKWDGVRALVVGDAKRIRLISRNGNDMTASYPELTDRSCWPEQDFVADGEIIAVGPSGRPDFGLLQGRMKLTRASDVAKARASTPVRLMLFDLLSEHGKDLRRLPLSDRRARLEAFFTTSGCPVELSQLIDGDVRHILESAEELGLEGVMAKRTDGRYVGQRSRSWLKLKFERTQEVVVGGWRPGKGERGQSVGSLLLGIPAGSRLRYVGRVGSGFSARELMELRQQLDALPRKTSPFEEVPAADASDAHWVSAKLVGEVTYGEWTGSGKLRHPVWRGWRLDKSAGGRGAGDRTEGSEKPGRAVAGRPGLLPPAPGPAVDSAGGGSGRVRGVRRGDPVDRVHRGPLRQPAVLDVVLLGMAVFAVAVRPLFPLGRGGRGGAFRFRTGRLIHGLR